METRWNEATIMESWRRCIRAGLQPDSEEKCYPLSEPEVRRLVDAHRAETEAFQSVVDDCPLPKDTAFLLMDQRGTLLKKISAGGTQWGIQSGFSFAEECAGTNAVALALMFKEPVWTLREQNYLSTLSRFSLYCVPCVGVLTGHYIALLTGGKQPSEWPIALLQQSAFHIAAEIQGRVQALKPPITVSRRQHEVLLCIAQGMKDVEIALSLHISLDTVRYHKKNIYQLLGADNRVSAVIQALKRRTIDIGQIGEW